MAVAISKTVMNTSDLSKALPKDPEPDGKVMDWHLMVVASIN
jgi:hypothetical protein